jgi:hypothetical protein
MPALPLHAWQTICTCGSGTRVLVAPALISCYSWAEGGRGGSRDSSVASVVVSSIPVEEKSPVRARFVPARVVTGATSPGPSGDGTFSKGFLSLHSLVQSTFA